MSWPEVHLSELTDVVTKGTTPTSLGMNYTESGIPFVRVNNLQDASVDLENDILFIGEDTHEALSRSKILPNDILISIAGTIGRTAIVPSNAGRANCNQAVAIIRPTDRVHRPFLRYWLESDQAKRQIGLSSVTGVISNLSLGQIKKLCVPLPPLEEQKRIAAILDQADTLRRLRKRAIDCLDTLAKSIFFEMFGDLLCAAPEAGRVPLGEIAEVASGITKGRKPPKAQLTSTPYLAVSNVQDGHLDLTTVKEIAISEDELEKYKLISGDLVLTEGGDPDKLGRGTIWNNEISNCIHQNHIFKVRIRDARFRPLFLSWLISSGYGRRYFLKSAKQTTGIASINKTQLSAFPVPYSDMGMQQEFESRLATIGAQKSNFKAASDHVDEIFQALQQRAFRGEL